MPIAAILTLVEAAIQETPALISELQTLFASGAPTAEQFEALRQKVSQENFGN